MGSADPANVHLTEFVTGVTLELGTRCVLPGAELVGLGGDGSYALHTHADESVDAIVSRGGLEHALDTVRTLESCGRVLREGGRLAIVIADGNDPNSWRDAPHAFTPEALGRTLTRIGCFEVVESLELEGEGASLVVAERSPRLDVGGVLGMHGTALTDLAQRGSEHRVEMLFQIGTMLLRAGEWSLARCCYETLLEVEPDHSECAFGLGMCHALERSWTSAVTWLTVACELDPHNREVRRWLGLAQLELDSKTHGLSPQAAVQDHVPADCKRA